MQEELNQLERNKVWNLVSRPTNHPVKQTDEARDIDRNKAILLAQGFIQEECIGYDETFVPHT